MAAFWPGLLGQDSLAILRVENLEILQEKFFGIFCRVFYQFGYFVEIPIFTALIFAQRYFTHPILELEPRI